MMPPPDPQIYLRVTLIFDLCIPAVVTQVAFTVIMCLSGDLEQFIS